MKTAYHSAVSNPSPGCPRVPGVEPEGRRAAEKRYARFVFGKEQQGDEQGEYAAGVSESPSGAGNKSHLGFGPQSRQHGIGEDRGQLDHNHSDAECQEDQNPVVGSGSAHHSDTAAQK